MEPFHLSRGVLRYAIKELPSITDLKRMRTSRAPRATPVSGRRQIRAVVAIAVGVVLLSGCASEPPRSWIAYRDFDGDSGVAAYNSGPGYIWVRFDDGSAYLYTDTSAGEDDIRTMQRLASAGDGLNAYINQEVRYDYAQKVE